MSGIERAAKTQTIPWYGKIESAGPDRPWLVMVHGASQHSGVFSAQVEAFRTSHRLLLIDLPGHGRSASVAGPYGLLEYAEGVLAALDRAGVGEMHFWGTHTGAGVGLLLATGSQRRRFSSLILDGAVLPGVDLPSVSEAINRAKATARASGVEAARREWFDRSAWFDVMRANPVQCRCAEHLRMVSGFAGGPWLDPSAPRPLASIEDRLRDIGSPVLLVNGEHDLDDFLMVAERLEKNLPNVRRHVIPDAGGFPLWEYPDRVNAGVKEFLDRP